MNISEASLKNIISLAGDLRFGELIIKVQDARIVAVEKHEKIRLKEMADSLSGEAKV
ncbi:MAG: YezD family protein [Candidatus Omnitrophota bacterium]